MLVENTAQTIKVFAILKWGKIIRMFRNREDSEQEVTNIYFNSAYRIVRNSPFDKNLTDIEIEKMAAYLVNEFEKIYSVQEVEL